MNYKIILCIGMSIIASGCTSIASINASSNTKLCLDYLTTPSYNVWKSDREAEIVRRGIDCSGYSSLAAQKIRSQDNAIKSLQAIGRSKPSSSGSSSSSPSTIYLKRDYILGANRICVYAGMSGEVVKTVGAADICPM